MEKNVPSLADRPVSPILELAEDGHVPATLHSRQSARVLIVEDDAALSTALQARLEDSGMTVSTARDGVAARWDLLTRPFDAIVLDLGLPGQSGLDLMHDLAGRVDLPPVVVLTGADTIDCELARVLGAHHVLQKPCPSWLLVDAIERVIRG